jgi:hypothetical protein
VHIGVAQYGSGAHGVTAVFAPVTFTTWLDASVRGDAEHVPAVTADAGQVSVFPGGAYVAGPPASAAQITYDPRNPDGRLAVGTHTITITWTVTSRGRRQRFTATTHAVVRDDGTVTVGAPAGPQSDATPTLPLERRFGARIVAQPDEHDAHALVLEVESPIDDAAPAYLWRATAGDLAHASGSRRAVWTLPREPGRHLVTCAVQGGRSEIAMASFSYDVDDRALA